MALSRLFLAPRTTLSISLTPAALGTRWNCDGRMNGQLKPGGACQGCNWFARRLPEHCPSAVLECWCLQNARCSHLMCLWPYTTNERPIRINIKRSTNSSSTNRLRIQSTTNPSHLRPTYHPIGGTSAIQMRFSAACRRTASVTCILEQS